MHHNCFQKSQINLYLKNLFESNFPMGKFVLLVFSCANEGEGRINVVVNPGCLLKWPAHPICLNLLAALRTTMALPNITRLLLRQWPMLRICT